jgi:LPXTG-motif cell wall-anchored protein
MINRLLQILHPHPITSTTNLLVIGIALIFAAMVFLSKKTNEGMAEQLH